MIEDQRSILKSQFLGLSLKIVFIYIYIANSFNVLIANEDCESIDEESNFYLEELIDLGLQNNPKTMKAWFDIKIAASSLKVSESICYPFVDYSWDGAYENEKTSYRIPDQIDLLRGTHYLGISKFMISYLLMDFGERENIIQSSYQALVSMKWTFEQTIQNVMLEILLAYYDYVQSKMLWDAALLDLKNAEESFVAVKNKYEAHYALLTDYLQAESSVLTNKSNEANARNRMQISKGILAKAIGLPADAKFQVHTWEEANVPEFAKSDIESLIDMAIELRPDLKARRSDYYQKYSLWKASQAAGLPTVHFNSTFLNIGYKGSDISHIHDYRCAISIQIPIFHGYYYYYQSKKALSEMDKSIEEWREAELAVMNNVWSSYYSFQAASESYAFAKRNVGVADQSFSATLEGYRLGKKEITDLLLAQSLISSARQNLIQIETSYRNSLSTLAFSLGILGWDVECDKTLTRLKG